MTNTLFEPLSFARGKVMHNRFMLAPLTNLQSHEDGTLSDDEYNWLSMRAQGGFGLTMTCATYVQEQGKGFAGQLGIWSDKHIDGLGKLAHAIRLEGSLSSVQLHHAGMRSPSDLIGTAPVAPWNDEKTGARALTTAEVEQVIEDFIVAAQRAERAGFDGVEIHGAHGYLIAQFFDAENNQRDDRYGGSFENRTRVLFEIIGGVRARTRADFQVGVRLSPERFGVTLAEARQLAQQLMQNGKIDYLDMSLWDALKEPVEEAFKGKPLIDYFTDLERGNTRLGVAGKITNAQTVQACMDKGADFVIIGRGGILHHDFPRQVESNPQFESIALPVTREYLQQQGLGPAFIHYMATGWKNFVAA
ncbi:MAG TPA: NADH:flavin oxidoreductase [Spongiibacteraceae bacterium]|jgi:2,4-dienoyl-CoA reductase-like NADH-dependent reductase (Old Yellow Enzyme family)